MDPKVDPKVAPRVDPRMDPRVDPRVDPKVDPRWTPGWTQGWTQGWTPSLFPKAAEIGYSHLSVTKSNIEEEEKKYFVSFPPFSFLSPPCSHCYNIRCTL